MLPASILSENLGSARLRVYVVKVNSGTTNLVVAVVNSDWNERNKSAAPGSILTFIAVKPVPPEF